jgi:hypothetical protein
MSPAVPQSGSNGTAKRLRRNMESPPGKVVMLTVVCYQCGAQFAIAHQSASQDQVLAERQAAWLADRFVWDHIQENNHQSSIPLPAAREMK